MRFYLYAATAAAAFCANPLTNLAADPQAERKPPITVPTRPPTTSTGGELRSLQNRARTAAAELNAKDAKALRQGNADLGQIHNELVTYAQKNNLKLTTTTLVHPAGTAAAMACDGTYSGTDKTCTLSKAWTDDKGVMHWQYDCVPIATQKKQ